LDETKLELTGGGGREQGVDPAVHKAVREIGPESVVAAGEGQDVDVAVGDIVSLELGGEFGSYQIPLGG
jgi:hypothetical protein